MGFFGKKQVSGDSSVVAAAANGMLQDPFQSSPLSQVDGSTTDVNFPVSSVGPGQNNTENTGAFGAAEPSQFLSMMANEAGSSANDKTRKLAIAGLVVACLAVAAVFLTGEEGGNILGSLFNSSNEQRVEAPAAQEAPPAQEAPAGLASATPEPEATDEATDEYESMPEPVETAISPATETYEYTKVGFEGEYSKEKVWEALKHVDDWRNAGEHDNQILSQYFAHRKVWVRLAALEVAVLQKGLSRDELFSAGKDICDNFNHGQIFRYMKRVQHRDINTFNEMMKFLQLI